MVGSRIPFLTRKMLRISLMATLFIVLSSRPISAFLPSSPSLSRSETQVKSIRQESHLSHLFNLVKSQFLPGDESAKLTMRDADDEAAGMKRLTDMNFEAYVTGKDVWVILVHGPEHDTLSQVYTDLHKDAAKIVRNADIQVESENENQRRGSFKFGRIDYMTEVSICTKWLIFKPPYIVIQKDDQSIRFLSPRLLPISGEVLADLLISGDWEQIPTWSSRYGPGGDREWIIDTYLIITKTITKITSRIPSVLWIFITGAIGQSVIAWMHRGKGAGQRGNEAEWRRYAEAAKREEEKRKVREEKKKITERDAGKMSQGVKRKKVYGTLQGE